MQEDWEEECEEEEWEEDDWQDWKQDRIHIMDPRCIGSTLADIERAEDCLATGICSCRDFKLDDE